ncbi:hypothetical protein GCM10008018_10060 [Paenibacillus marchantiophytorum]|uniref:DUF917 family protein n=1 Tax=Paenibacillus marchantiophytorum TaxID=1619310 RepID=A0ABQ2BSC6_9BACL|nr:DUF917 family protein [Paenibacillus marchantiophytorum]GGI45031.1 hypothetical protein GCM10008018_10060 [Paenibacillus marchantiophytorum]
MAKTYLDERMMEFAVYGGAILGGGGGGWIEDGLKLGRLALEVGSPQLFSVDELMEDDMVLTTSLVGAPAAKEKFVKPIHYVRAMELMSDRVKKPINGIITNENGANTTVNGWFQAVVTGLPVVDLACNGRAHPTSIMGAMNLHERLGYVSHQAAVGGQANRYTEVVVSGTIEQASTLVRRVSIDAGGLVAVARNPVTVGYATANGAPGAISQAIELGETLLSHKGESAIEAVCAKLGGTVIMSGVVTAFTLKTDGGFDVGHVTIEEHWELTFWNEYMTLEHKGQRLATFPDLIMTLDANTARPLVSAAITKGQAVAIIYLPKSKLLLSTTMSRSDLLQSIEEVIGKPINAYHSEGRSTR